ncbi:hypothetical protein BD413DRAFT_222493 [Trametes elegans]|nr:hypothetical protein BD413DRAFT_222493 [Trametes elegans]
MCYSGFFTFVYDNEAHDTRGVQAVTITLFRGGEHQYASSSSIEYVGLLRFSLRPSSLQRSGYLTASAPVTIERRWILAVTTPRVRPAIARRRCVISRHLASFTPPGRATPAVSVATHCRPLWSSSCSPAPTPRTVSSANSLSCGHTARGHSILSVCATRWGDRALRSRFFA